MRSSARNSSLWLTFNKKTDIDRGAAEYFRVAHIERLPATLPFPDMRRLTQALQGTSCDKKVESSQGHLGFSRQERRTSSNTLPLSAIEDASINLR